MAGDDMVVYVSTDRPDLPPLPNFVTGDGGLWYEQTRAERQLGVPPKQVDWDELVALGYYERRAICDKCEGKGHL